MKTFFGHLLNVPNSISLFRIAASPVLALLFLWTDHLAVGLALGTVIGLSDLFDGVLARKLNQQTELGALIDQLGDLVFESTCLLIGVMVGELWVGILIIYLFREFTVQVARSYVLSRGGSLPSTILGKAKSNYLQWAFFMFFLGVIVLQPGAVPPQWNVLGFGPGRILIFVATCSIWTGVVMSLLSGGIYLRAFARFYSAHQEAGR